MDKKEKNKFLDNKVDSYSKIILRPTEKELLEHKEFINNHMKKNFY